ncbi:hypothetical protein A7978_06065 (plasmid) [Borrelia turicatae]|uniref:Uncharacterized protein n=1 Tax=Borrelia turicatae TaxID=142 RepID=A0A172XCV8_BORTU|nr:hypothetical protein [Borrelia turicatae]ANF34490.1 hypothetical protein A7978_06065 [Borrelia turicatae]UPA15572.1 hypothetical protein btBTE5EL_001258 [Borrelia turicatae]
MSISNKDYKNLKLRIASSNTRIQFGVGDHFDSKGYTGEIGEPILLKDKGVFAVCDGKSIANRRYYPINKNMSSVLDDTLDATLEHMIDFFIEKVAVGTLTAKFPIEGSKLRRYKLIEAFTSTNKFCIPDGRSLPSNCYAARVLGISSAPNLAGRFLRHCNILDFRVLGSTQSDALESHIHGIDYTAVNYGSYQRLFKQAYQASRENSWYWKDGTYAFVLNIALGDYFERYHFPSETKPTGTYETRPKNLSYLSFFRYDL